MKKTDNMSSEELAEAIAELKEAAKKAKARERKQDAKWEREVESRIGKMFLDVFEGPWHELDAGMVSSFFRDHADEIARLRADSERSHRAAHDSFVHPAHPRHTSRGSRTEVEHEPTDGHLDSNDATYGD